MSPSPAPPTQQWWKTYLIPTKSNCRRFLDEDDSIVMEGPSPLCRLFIALHVIMVVVRLILLILIPRARIRNSIALFAHALFALWMHMHCQLCDGVMGFLKILLVSLIIDLVVLRVARR